ncbi:MAG: catalase-peroxidase, partial [Boseongicola sp.]|nr:catalase-peroxidase [Boseongicola sp.]
FRPQPGKPAIDFLVTLLDMATAWSATSEDESTFEGKDRISGDARWTATRADLYFGLDSELSALEGLFACSDASGALVSQFIDAWVKTMELGRFDFR